MSSSEEDERKEYVKSEPNIGSSGATSEVVISQSGDGTVRQVIVEPAPNVQSESVVKHKSTNTSALIGMAVGIVVLSIGLFLVIRETPFLPYPWSLFSIIIVGVALIGIGGSLISNRTSMK